MQTAPKTFPSGPQGPKNEPLSSEELRRERITGIIVLVIVAALMALVIWLASLGNGGTEQIPQYWPMM